MALPRLRAWGQAPVAQAEPSGSEDGDVPENEATLTTLEILDEIRKRNRDEDVRTLVDLLAVQLGVQYLPQRTFAAATEIFGGSIYNPASRSHKSLSRRVEHALRVWAEKYGPLTPDQADYADHVLAAALRSAAKEAAGDRSKLFAFAQAQIGRVVNHERVHEGFQRRTERVEVGDVLEGVA